MEVHALLRLERAVCNGEYDCLRNCCGTGVQDGHAIRKLRALFAETLRSDSDVDMFIELLCAPCDASPPKPYPGPHPQPDPGPNPNPKPDPGPGPVPNPPGDPDTCFDWIAQNACSTPVQTALAGAKLALGIALVAAGDSDLGYEIAKMQMAVDWAIFGCSKLGRLDRNAEGLKHVRAACTAYRKLEINQNLLWVKNLMRVLVSLAPGGLPLVALEALISRCCTPSIGQKAGFTVEDISTVHRGSRTYPYPYPYD